MTTADTTLTAVADRTGLDLADSLALVLAAGSLSTDPHLAAIAAANNRADFYDWLGSVGFDRVIEAIVYAREAVRRVALDTA